MNDSSYKGVPNHMKQCFLWAFLLISCCAFGQAAGHTGNSKKAPLLLANKEWLPPPGNQTSASQASAWKFETEENPLNAAAWLNYYLWTSRDKLSTEKQKSEKLAAIFSDAQTHVAESSEYYLLKYLQSGNKDLPSLDKALELSFDKTDLYRYKIRHAVITNHRDEQIAYARQLYTRLPMPGAYREYYYNVLQSADSNAIIYAQGVFDLSSLAFLQHVNKVRTDIQLKYYDGSVITEPNAYLVLSLGSDVLKKYPAAGYSGLLLKVSGATIEDLKKSIGRFDLTIMRSDNIESGSEAPAFYKNYLPSFLLFYQYLKNNNDVSKDDWKLLINRLAERSGTQTEKPLLD